MDSPAEWTRIQAEWARIAAEWTRKLAEWTNSVAEWTRKFAEWTRKWPNGLARFIKKVRRMDSRSVFFQNVFFTTGENESESIQRRRMDSFRKMWARTIHDCRRSQKLLTSSCQKFDVQKFRRRKL